MVDQAPTDQAPHALAEDIHSMCFFLFLWVCFVLHQMLNYRLRMETDPTRAHGAQASDPRLRAAGTAALLRSFVARMVFATPNCQVRECGRVSPHIFALLGTSNACSGWKRRRW